MSGPWSSIWRLIGNGVQSTYSRTVGLSTFHEACKTSGLKVQCLQQTRLSSVRRGLLLLHTNSSCGMKNPLGILTYRSNQTAHSRSAHSLPGSLSRNPKPSRRFKIKEAPQRPQFNFSAREIQLVFPSGLAREEGNRLLQILQEQRESGTLDQEVDASPLDVFAGLEWLRIKFPVDEDRAIIARLEREEKEDDEKAKKISSYTPQRDAPKTGLYGPSRFEELRKINKQKAAEKAAQLEKAKMEDPGTKEIQAQNTSGGALATRRMPNWVVRYREAATMQGKMPPAMSKFERLWPSAVVTFMVVGLSLILAEFYIPPSRRARLLPDLPPAAATIIGLVGINFAIYLAWKVPPFWAFMNRTFIMTAAYPYARGIVGAVISHQALKHLVMNMVFLWWAGTRCASACPRLNLFR